MIKNISLKNKHFIHFTLDVSVFAFHVAPAKYFFDQIEIVMCFVCGWKDFTFLLRDSSTKYR